MRWTIGMPSYNNFTEVWFTIQALRMYHDLTDCEILVVDNYGDDNLKKYIEHSGGDTVRYIKYNKVIGVSAAKNKIFEHARGEYVLCIDSHIIIGEHALDTPPPDDDMVQGILMQSNCNKYWCEWLPEWRAQMWGIWGKELFINELPSERFEIWGMGAGFFAVRRDSWLGFNEEFRGFGGETGYIQEKYRKHGRKVWCYPNMIWQHFFANGGRKITYPLHMYDRVRNYLIGFNELGLDIEPIKKVFSNEWVSQILRDIEDERTT
jgi:glycosyltransferase involved in cell wall biosynthesis